MAKKKNSEGRESLEEFGRLKEPDDSETGVEAGVVIPDILNRVPNTNTELTNNDLISIPEFDRPVIFTSLGDEDSEAISGFKFDGCEASDFFSTEPEECEPCLKNPFAFVPDWTSMLEGEVFFNGKECQHCVVMYSDDVNPQGAALKKVKEDGVKKLIEVFRKASVAKAVYYVPRSQRNKDIIPPISIGEEFTLAEIGGVLPTFHIFGALLDLAAAPPPARKGFVRVTETFNMVEELDAAATIEKHTPISSAIGTKVLVCVPSAQLEKIPQAILSEPDTEFESKLTVTILGPDFARFVNKTKKTFTRYNKQVLRWAVFDGGLLLKKGSTNRDDYVVLDLLKEKDFLSQFQKELLDMLKTKGLTTGPSTTVLEKFTINFEEEGDKLKIKEVIANSGGCRDIVFSRTSNSSEFNKFMKKRSSLRSTTLGYIGALPEMDSAISARKPMSWLEYVTKFTYPGLEVSLGPNAIVKSNDSCFADDQINIFLNSMLDALIDLGGDILSETNKTLCRTVDESETYKRDLNKQADDNLRRILIAEVKMHGNSKPFVDLLIKMLEKQDLDFESLWSDLIDKMGYCGWIQMAKNSIDCLAQGLGADSLEKAMVEAIFKAIPEDQIEKVFVGLPPDVQKKITDKIGASFNNAPAPWDAGYRSGNYSGPGFNPKERAKAVKETKAEPGFTPTPIPTRGAGRSRTELPNTTARKIVKAREKENQVDPTQVSENQALRGSGGTYGNMLGDIQKEIFAAYKDAILEFAGVQQLMTILEDLPGVGIVAQVFRSSPCTLPGPLNFEPPLDSFLNTLEFDFCNIPGGNWADLTLPKMNPPMDKGVPIKIAASNIMKVIGEIAKEVLIALAMQLFKKILTGMIKAISGIACEALKTLGGALGDLVNGNDKLKDGLKKQLCPDKDLSDEEFAATLNKLFNSLNPVDPTCLETITNEEIGTFIDDILLVLTQGQILDLLAGVASQEVLEIVTRTALSSESECISDIFSDPSAVDSYFDGLGDLLNLDDLIDELGQFPRELPNTVCTPEMLEDIDDLRCQLLQQKGMSLQDCRDELDRLKAEAEKNLGDLADVLQNGPFADLPGLLSTADCPTDGLFPYNDLNVMDLTPHVIGPVFTSISNEHTADLLGSDGVLNNILSDTNGKRLRAHNFYVRHFGNPNSSNLSFFEWYSDNSIEDHDATFLKPNPIDQFGNKLKGAEASGNSIVAAIFGSHGGFPPTVGSWLMKQYEELDISFSTKRLTEDQLALEEILEDNPFISFSPASNDLELNYIDFKSEYSFKLVYDYNIEENGELLKNKYRVKIIEDLDPSDDGNLSRVNIPKGTPPSILQSRGGTITSGDFTISSVPSEEVRILLGTLNLENDSKISYESEALKEYISSVLKSNIDLSQDSKDKLESNSHRSYVTNIFDIINKGFLRRISDKIITPAEGKEIPKGFAFGYDADRQPEVVLLDPEKYGGNEISPAFYVKPPKRDGWMGMLDELVPEWDACEPRRTPMCDFEGIKDDVQDLYGKLKEDKRREFTPLCTEEAPYDKMLDRMAAASLDGVVRTALRIYIVDVLLRVIPVITQFELNIPENFDALLEEYIVDYSIERIKEEDKKVFGGSNHYYYRFLEQVVNNIARKIDSKIISMDDLTPEEKEAFDSIADTVARFYTTYQGKLESLSTTAITTQDFVQRAFSHKNAELGDGSAAFNKLEAKRAKEEVFNKIIGSTQKEAKILMRRYVREEFEHMRGDFNDRLKPTISNLDSLFLGSESWIQGAVSSGGPKNVFSDPTENNLFETREGEIPNWPFVLEKYVLIEEKDDPQLANRDENLFHIVNMSDWEDYVQKQRDDGITGDISKYWKSWKFGIRVVYKPINAFDNAYWSPLTTGATREQRMKHKAFLIGENDAYIPLVNAELEIEDQEFTDFDPEAYDVFCLIKELRKKTEYKMLFKYCFPMQRFLSLLTLYSAKGFYPSIGNIGAPEEGGDRWVLAGGRALFGFRAWDRQTFERSSKQARIMFETIYETTNKDTTYKVRGQRTVSANFRDTLRPKINFDTGLRWWQRRNRRNRPYDKFGNDCEDE